MNRVVLQVIAATVLSVLGVGCATSSATHGSRYTEAQVAFALADTERSTLTRLSDSVDPETASIARRMALGECR